MWYFRAVIPQQLKHGSTSMVVLRRSTGRWDFFVANPTCCMMNSAFLMVKPPCFVGLWVLVLIKPYQTSIFCSLFGQSPWKRWGPCVWLTHLQEMAIKRSFKVPLGCQGMHKGCPRLYWTGPGRSQLGNCLKHCAKDGKMNRFGINMNQYRGGEANKISSAGN